jgi:hypothetical protein
MRIAMLSPIAWRTPPRDYGPWEQVVSLLTEGLVKRGVDVTLFATGDSLTTATLHAVVARGYEEDHELDAKVMECLHIAHVFEHADEFDLIHNHFDFLALVRPAYSLSTVSTTRAATTSPSATPIAHPSSTTLRTPTTASTRKPSPTGTNPATTSSSSAASTRTKAPPKPSRSRGARGGGW